MAARERVELEVQGMTCADCARHVQRALEQIPGVVAANVPGWEAGQATATVSPDVATEALTQAVAQAGYQATVTRRRLLQAESVDAGAAATDMDLMVIGAGSAGFAAAIKGAELGFQVALVEESTMGGTCVNVGCVPSKTLIRAMERYHQAGTPRFAGVQTTVGALNWAQVIQEKDALVAQMRKERYADVLDAYPSIVYIRGHARLTGANSVDIDGQAYTPDKIIIATGARPSVPSISGLEEAGYLTSTTAMARRERPDSLIVLGAGAVGLELAQLFARAGTTVTVVEVLSRIAPAEDAEIGQALRDYLEAEGIRVLTDFDARQLERRNGRYVLQGVQGGEEVAINAAQLLVATGRRANTSGMGLEEAGVALGERQEIMVTETLQTGNPHIYAAGDVLGEPMFVYVAAYAGTLAAENGLTGAARRYDIEAIPRVTFTDPQIASAGLTEAQARASEYDVQVSSLPMARVPRALAARDTRGLIKLVVDSDSDRLLGVHILAPDAGEVIQTAVLALRFGLTATELRQTLFPYLTNVEGLKLAALALEKDVALLSCCAG